MMETRVLTPGCDCGINKRYSSTYISLRSVGSSSTYLPVLNPLFGVPRDKIPITQSSDVQRQYTSEDNNASSLDPINDQVHTS